MRALIQTSVWDNPERHRCSKAGRSRGWRKPPTRSIEVEAPTREGRRIGCDKPRSGPQRPEEATLRTIVTALLDTRSTRLRGGQTVAATRRGAPGERAQASAGASAADVATTDFSLVRRHRVIAWTHLHCLLSGDTRHCAGKLEDIAASAAVKTGFTVDASASIELTGQGPFGGAGKHSAAGPTQRFGGGNGQ
jgi:hypothetical protein